MHVLIIEDEIQIAMMIADLVDELGLGTVDVAASADEALACADRRVPDLIMSDMHLAAGTAIDVVEAICARAAVPVLFVTASSSDVRERMPDATIVEKPFTLPMLEAGIRTVMDRPSA
jgi:DNA-binding response OmpR family regulator